MCAIHVKKEYEEDLCRLKEDKVQRHSLDAVFKTSRVGLDGADVTKNVPLDQQDPECPYIKKEVEKESPHIKDEEEPGHHCGRGPHTGGLIAPQSDCDIIIVSHSDTDSDDEHSQGFTHQSDHTGTTTKVGTRCINKEKNNIEKSVAMPEGSDDGGMDSSTATKKSSVCEVNTDQHVCLHQETLDEEQQHQGETELFSCNEENFVCEMNTEQQSSLSLEMLDEEQHQAADSFSYTEEAFVCQMHKRRSTESFHSRQLPQHQRDLIVERYQSGEGYKRISKGLNIPLSTVKSVIVKWRKNGTTVPLPRSGRPSKIDEKTRRELVREAVKRPMATLKELQEFLASTGCSVHVTTISRLLHMSGLWGRVAR